MSHEIRTSLQDPIKVTVVFDPENEPSLTQQQFQKECDINYIVRQNEQTGLLNHVNQQTPQWGDFGDATDYQASLNLVNAAQASFMALPADVRARFDNDPAKLLTFVTDPNNGDELVRLGLATKPSDASAELSPIGDTKTPSNAE